MRKITFLLATAVVFTTSSVEAVILNIYHDRTAFLTDLGAPPLATQDFSFWPFYSADMAGVPFMPGGVNVTTNAENLMLWPPDKSLQAVDGGQTRAAGALYYDIHVNHQYSAFGFDILDFNPQASPGVMDMWFSDGSHLFDGVLSSGPTELDPTFFGVIASETITSFRWHEGLLGSGANDETRLDNFVGGSGSVVPEPGTMLLLGTGLAGLGAMYPRLRRR